MAATHNLNAVCCAATQLGPYFMRTVLKVAFSLLIWPMLVMAQDHVVSDQYTPPAQNAAPEGFVDPSLPATAPSSTPIQIPVLVQTTPMFAYVRPSKPIPTIAAGYAPALDISAGFAVSSFGLPASKGRAVLSGVDASIATDTGRHFGAKLDFGYEHAPNLYHSGHPMDVFTYLIGPVFYPTNGDLLSTQIHILLGGARVAGPVPTANGTLSIGHVNYPAWEVGGGVEYRLSPAFGFRVNVDFLQTHFYNFSGNVRPQNDIHIANSLVYYLGRRIRNH
jgi:hypothetical protein